MKNTGVWKLSILFLCTACLPELSIEGVLTKKSIKSKYNFKTKFWNSGHSKLLCNLHIAHAHCRNVGFFSIYRKTWKKISNKSCSFFCHYLTNLLFNKIKILFNSDFQWGTQFGYKTFRNLHSLKYHTNMQLHNFTIGIFLLQFCPPSSELESNLGLRNG